MDPATSSRSLARKRRCASPIGKVLIPISNRRNTVRGQVLIKRRKPGLDFSNRTRDLLATGHQTNVGGRNGLKPNCVIA